MSGSNKRNDSIIKVSTPSSSSSSTTTSLAGLENWRHHTVRNAASAVKLLVYIAPRTAFLFWSNGSKHFLKRTEEQP